MDQGPGRIPNPPVETVQVDPPGSGTTANYNIWALGPLAPGATRSFVWRVIPGEARSAQDLLPGVRGPERQGRRRSCADGAPPAGSFTVNIASRPPQAHVDPTTGKVVAGPYVPSEG